MDPIPHPKEDRYPKHDFAAEELLWHPEVLDEFHAFRDDYDERFFRLRLQRGELETASLLPES